MTGSPSQQDPRLDPRHAPPWQPLDRLSTGHLWRVAKQIDELGGEWTYPIFLPRTLNFNLVSLPIHFYEPVEGFDRLALEVALIQKAHSFGLGYTAGSAGMAFTIFPSIYSASDGVVRFPEHGEQAIGQHYMNAIGARGSNEIIFVNSWSGWTSDGLAYVSREYFDQYAIEGWVLRPWDFGPSEETAEPLLATSRQDEFQRLWQRRRRFGTSSSVVRNRDVKLKWFACWGLQDKRPMEVLVIELKKRIRVAVAILAHYEATENTPAASSIIDFFVWPNYRRVGYGRLLEQFAAKRSVLAGSSEIATHVWNADAIKGRSRAEAFLEATGYNDVQEYNGRQYALYARRVIAGC